MFQTHKQNRHKKFLKPFFSTFEMEYRPAIYHPSLEESDTRLSRKWAPRALAQANFSSIFVRSYFKDIHISINPYNIFSDLKYIEFFIKNSIERGLPLSEIGAKLSPFILCWNLLPQRRDNLMPKIRQKELVNFISEPARFSMGLMSCGDDSYQIESMRDILRQNLWSGETTENIFYIYSTAPTISLAEIILMVNFSEDNEIFSAITARAIGRSQEREGVRAFVESTHFREPLKGYLLLEGIQQGAPKDTILTLLPQEFKMAVSEDDEVFE